MNKLAAIWTKYFSSINAIFRASLGLGIVALFVVYYIIDFTLVEDRSRGSITFLQRLEETGVLEHDFDALGQFRR